MTVEIPSDLFQKVSTESSPWFPKAFSHPTQGHPVKPHVALTLHQLILMLWNHLWKAPPLLCSILPFSTDH